MTLVYAFPFRPSGRRRHRRFRPVARVRLSGPGGHSRVLMLVDSGADCALIGVELARRLGLRGVGTGAGRGLSTRVPVWRSYMTVEVQHASGFLPAVEVPVDVVIGGHPPFPILGREGFFEFYDVLFRAGPDLGRGMFFLSPHDGLGDRRAVRRLPLRSGSRERTVSA